MKRTLLSAAISVISLAGFSQAAQAANYDVYLAGSSAQDGLVLQEIYGLCTSTSFTYYQDNASKLLNDTTTGSWGSNYKAYSCNLTSAAATTAGIATSDVVTFHKVNFGGSAQGVAPLFQNVGVPTLNVNNGNCYSAGNTAKLPDGTIIPAAQVKGCRTTSTNDLVAHNLDAGLSDVNPTLFQGVNTAQYVSGGVIQSFNPVTSVPAGFTVVPGVSLTWGFPVTSNLYVALQAAQGLLKAGCAAGAYTDACMPSLSKPFITSLISGGITDWSSVNFNGTDLVAAAAAYDTTVSAANAISPTDTVVNFCQRLPGSGTAAGQYAYFLNQPANQFVSGVTPASSLFDYIYTVADGGNMEKCLDDLATGAATANDITGGLVKVTSGAASATYKGWGFGQQSTDKNATLAKHYNFVKINGVAPTLANVYAGTYDFTSESTWQYKTFGATLTAQQKLVKSLVSAAQNPYKIWKALNSGTAPAFGLAGFEATLGNAVLTDATYVLPTSFVAPTSATPTAVVNFPVNPWTHAVLGGVLDGGAFPILNPASTVAP
jgi:hypothetical protein